ncbi:OmpP1/FadL family transporter [Lysobacter korlensis]|uniref:OmpP1/FadL family transporter n=1 Tax=Lysobacter korlensis TaxID=553636 RepID=A0ABV6RR36_9GAMM
MQYAHRITRLSALAMGIAGALAFGQVHASGFQLKENSVKSMGSAFSGSAVAKDDTSVVVNNPALMTRFTGTAVQTDLSVINVDSEFSGGGFDITGRPLSGSNGGDVGDPAAVPAMSVVHKFDNGLAVGAMVSAPFGLKTEYERDFVGRYYAIESGLEIVNLTLSAALDVVPDRFSVGAGLVFSRADVTLSKAVDFGSLLFLGLPPAARPTAPAFARPQGSDGFAEITGADNGIGWVIGAALQATDKLTIGFSHQSEIDYDLEGEADWTVPTQARATLDAVGRAALFRDGAVTADLTTPSITTLAVSYQFTDAFKLSTTYAETGWESLEEVRINFANPDPDSVEEFNWSTTRFMALGGEFKLNDAWMLRAGYAYDETPTTYQFRTPRLPDEDRKWYSLGATWQFSDALQLNFAYTHIKPDRPVVAIVTPPAQGGQRLFGSYDSAVNLFGVSAQYRF